METLRTPGSTRLERFRRCEAARLLPFIARSDPKLAEEAFKTTRSLLSTDPDPWVRAAAAASLVGLRLHLPSEGDGPPEFRAPLPAPEGDPLRASFLDRVRTDPTLGRDFLEAHRGAPDAVLTGALLKAALQMDPSPSILEFVKDVIATDSDGSRAAAAVSILGRFSANETAQTLDSVLRASQPAATAQALRIAATLGVPVRDFEDTLSRFLRLPSANVLPGASSASATSLKAAAAEATVGFAVRRENAACEGLIRDILRPGGDPNSQAALADALAGAGTGTFLPELRLAYESTPEFRTRDAIARALSLLDPGGGPPSLRLEIERLKQRLDAEPLAPGERAALARQLNSKQADYVARSRGP
jgi:hypothetical protein